MQFRFREHWANQTGWTGNGLPMMLAPPFNSNYAAPIGDQTAGIESGDAWGMADVGRKFQK